MRPIRHSNWVPRQLMAGRHAGFSDHAMEGSSIPADNVPPQTYSEG